MGAAARIEILNERGQAMRRQGSFAAAQRYFRQAIAASPTCGRSYRNLILSGPIMPNDPVIRALREQLADPDRLAPDDRIHMQFAYADVLASQGAHAVAFDHYEIANKLQRARTAYDGIMTLSLHDRVRSEITPSLLSLGKGSGFADAAPVFVIGMPRTGSSLIEQILVSHRHIAGAGERADFSHALSETIRSLPGGPPQSDRDAVHKLYRSHLAALGANYLNRLRTAPAVRAKTLPRHIIDKFPFNFVYLGLIHSSLPKARFIHIRRDPIDTCLSCYKRLFADVPFSYDLRELGQYHLSYQRLMEHWRDTLPPGVMLEVDYESLIMDLPGQSARMLDHLGLDWDDSCLSFHRTERLVMTESAYQVRQPLYRTPSRHFRPHASRLAPLTEALSDHRGPPDIDDQSPDR